MTRLADIRALLEDALGNEALVHLVTTRVALRTGVDLCAEAPPGPAEDGHLERVLSALQDMGYSLQSLARVADARRNKGGSL